MSNCIKSRYEKCPPKDNCFDLVDDSEDCKCRLEDYQKGRADAIEEFAEKLADSIESFEVDFPNCRNVSICTLDSICEQIFDVAEQLKEQKHE